MHYSHTTFSCCLHLNFYCDDEYITPTALNELNSQLTPISLFPFIKLLKLNEYLSPFILPNKYKCSIVERSGQRQSNYGQILNN